MINSQPLILNPLKTTDVFDCFCAVLDSWCSTWSRSWKQHGGSSPMFTLDAMAWRVPTSSKKCRHWWYWQKQVLLKLYLLRRDTDVQRYCRKLRIHIFVEQSFLAGPCWLWHSLDPRTKLWKESQNKPALDESLLSLTENTVPPKPLRFIIPFPPRPSHRGAIPTSGPTDQPFLSWHRQQGQPSLGRKPAIGLWQHSSDVNPTIRNITVVSIIHHPSIHPSIHPKILAFALRKMLFPSISKFRVDIIWYNHNTINVSFFHFSNGHLKNPTSSAPLSGREGFQECLPEKKLDNHHWWKGIQYDHHIPLYTVYIPPILRNTQWFTCWLTEFTGSFAVDDRKLSCWTNSRPTMNSKSWHPLVI